MYNPESSKELKEIQNSVDEMERMMAADNIGHVEEIPVLRVPPENSESGEIGRRMTRMERRRMREEGASAPTLEVPVGRRQGEALAPEEPPKADVYRSEKQRHRWFPFGHAPKNTPDSNPQSRPYFPSNEGRRMIVNTPDYDHSTYFRHEEDKRTSVLDRARKPASPEPPQDSTSILDRARRPISSEQPQEFSSILDRARRSTSPEQRYESTSILDRARKSTLPEQPQASPSVLDMARNTTASESPEPVTSAPVETTDESPEESPEPTAAVSVETIDESPEESPEPAASTPEEDEQFEDDTFDFDNLDLSIPSFEEDETEATPDEESAESTSASDEGISEESSEPEPAPSSEEAAPEAAPEEPSDTTAPNIVPRMRINIHQDYRSASALNKPTVKKPGVYNPYTNSYDSPQWRPLEDTNTDSPQTV